MDEQGTFARDGSGMAMKKDGLIYRPNQTETTGRMPLEICIDDTIPSQTSGGTLGEVTTLLSWCVTSRLFSNTRIILSFQS